MADNTTLNPASGGDTIRDKDRAGVKTQIVALDLNPAGSETLMNGKMPVTVADGDSATVGALADAKVTGDNTGSLSAKLRGLLYEVGDQADVASATGSLLAKVRQLAVLLNGGLPAALGSGGGLKVDGSGTALPVSQSGSNWSVNQAQVAGTATDVNSGNKSAGTQRVVLATDQPALTNALKVDPSGVTSPVSLASLPALAAGTNLAGKVSASMEASTIYNGTTAVTMGFGTISTSSSGATTIQALVSSKQIYVTSLALTANGTVNVKFQSHVTPTDLTGLFYLVANAGFVLPFNQYGWFRTVSGEALDINLSAAIAVGGCFTYIAF